MNRRYGNLAGRVLLSIVASAAACAASADKITAVVATPTGGRMVAGEVLVRLRTVVISPRLGSLGTVQPVANSNSFVKIRLKQGIAIDSALRQLRLLPEVQCADPNYIRSICVNDPEYVANNQYALPLMKIDQAWNAWKPLKQVVIGIVDTGINSDHPDLTNMMLKKPNGTLIGYNAITNTEITGPSDDHGHGTFCAGEADAETNNSTGVAAFAYAGGASSQSYFVKLMPLKMLDYTGNGTDADLIKAINWGLQHGVNVFSMSIGGADASAALNSAAQDVWDAGAMIVAAAGNGNSTNLSYPAACPQVISVAATDSQDRFASFSNYGSWVNVAAPGVSIRSTTRGGGYGYSSGTSMACPLVAGTAAFLWAQNPTLSNSALRSTIFNTTDALPTGQSKTIQYGRVNVKTARDAVKSPPLSGKALINGWLKVDGTAYKTGNLVRIFVFAPNSTPTHESDALAFADVPLDERGVYALPSGVVPDGTYRIGIKPITAPGLAALLPGNVVLSAANPPIVPDLAVKLGDGTRDGYVDISDLLQLIAHYNQLLGVGDYALAADINGDGANDIADLLLIVTNYNQAADFLP